MGVCYLFFIVKRYPNHRDEILRLRRIEGQIRGIQTMIEGRRYCVDILTALQAVTGAIRRVEEKILERHLDSCVAAAIGDRSKNGHRQKIQEVIELISGFRK